MASVCAGWCGSVGKTEEMLVEGDGKVARTGQGRAEGGLQRCILACIAEAQRLRGPALVSVTAGRDEYLVLGTTTNTPHSFVPAAECNRQDRSAPDAGISIKSR